MVLEDEKVQIIATRRSSVKMEVFKMVFQREIDELLNEKQKEMEIGKIKKAIIAGDLEEADVLFKYSLLTPEEYQSIKIEFHQK